MTQTPSILRKEAGGVEAKICIRDLRIQDTYNAASQCHLDVSR